jgi:hypothetical protein
MIEPSALAAAQRSLDSFGEDDRGLSGLVSFITVRSLSVPTLRACRGDVMQLAAPA